MLIRPGHLGYFALLAVALLFGSNGPAGAATLSMQDCGAKYQAAKSAGTLNGADWTSFRATQCGIAPVLVAAPAATPGTPTATPAPIPAVPTAVAPGAPAKPVAAGSPVLPSKIDPKYASLKGGKARMKTCDDQYKINKANGGNGGLKWIQKGGGYYSVCQKHLKAA